MCKGKRSKPQKQGYSEVGVQSYPVLRWATNTFNNKYAHRVWALILGSAYRRWQMIMSLVWL